MRYFLFFPAGMVDLVLRALEMSFPDGQVEYADDSSVLIRTKISLKSADSLPFAKNCFEVLGDVPRRSLNHSVADLAKRADRFAFSRTSQNSGFRIMYHVDGQLTSVETRTRARLESVISAGTGLRIQSRGSGVEYWVIGRSESSRIHLGRRLPKKQPPKNAKGALSVELASLIVFSTEPHPRDRFLDPFAGSGALVRARLNWPYRGVTYNDLETSPEFVRASSDLKGKRHVHFLREDGLVLKSVPDAAITAIATDPPWGEYENVGLSTSDFKARLSATLVRVLDPDIGRLSLLVNRRASDGYAAQLERSGLAVSDVTDLLVNGHPASVIHAGNGFVK